jgi:16S rRNA (cytosine967-C5)-methyltransferase
MAIVPFSAMTLDPRKSALLILNRLDATDKTLDALMDEFHAAQGSMPRRDRALMQALVYGVLRRRSRIDGIISRFSKSGLRKIKPDVLNILRLGVFQILHMDRIPDAAAVNTAVEMAKSLSAPWTVRFVNAILRRTAAGPIPAAANPSEENAIPGWLFSRWCRRFGKRQSLAICHAVNTVPPITVRTNTLKTARSDLLSALSKSAGECCETVCSPEGISLFTPAAAVSGLPGYPEGHFQVQDEAAQITGHIFSPRPGETVLDACAGLGGKTGHIAQLMNNQGALVAMDRDRRKLARLESEMIRLGVSIVTTSCHDLSSPPAGVVPAAFDRILLDAPCSGLGVLRRNPDAKWRVTLKDIKRLQRVQYDLLGTLSPSLKPSGTLLYVVCSTEPEENESVVSKFLENHPGFQADPIDPSDVIPENCITEDGFFKTYPHGLSMDGFFAARLKRIS